MQKSASSTSTEVFGEVFSSKNRQKSHASRNGVRTRDRSGSTDVSAGMPLRDPDRTAFHTTVHGRQGSGSRDSGRSLSTHEHRNGFSAAPMPPSQYLSRDSAHSSGSVEISDDFVHDLLADHSSGSTGEDSPKRHTPTPPPPPPAHRSSSKPRIRHSREAGGDEALLRAGGIRTRDPTSPTGTVPIYEVLLELLQLERSTSLKELERHMARRIDALDARLQEFRVGDEVLDTLAQTRQAYKDLVEFFRSSFSTVMRMERQLDERAEGVQKASSKISAGLEGYDDRIQSLERSIASTQRQIGALQDDFAEVKKNQETLLELARGTQAQNASILRALDARAADDGPLHPPPRAMSSGKGHKKGGSGLSFAATVFEEDSSDADASSRSPRDKLKKKMSTSNLGSLRAKVEGHYAVDKGEKVGGSARVPRSRRQRSSTSRMAREAPAAPTRHAVPPLKLASTKNNEGRPATARHSPSSSPKEASETFSRLPQTARESPTANGPRKSSARQSQPLFEEDQEMPSDALANIFGDEASMSPSFAEAIRDAAEVTDGTMVWGRGGARVPVSIIYTQEHTESPGSSGSPTNTTKERHRITSSSSSEKTEK